MNSHRELYYCTNVISLQVINSVNPSFNALSREISRIIIPYLRAAMYYFFYYINTIGIYRQIERRLYQGSRICHSFTNLIKWREKRVTSSSGLAIPINIFYMINICFRSSSLQRYSSLKFSFSTFTVTTFVKIYNGELFLTVNNSRKFCTKYFCSQKRKCPVKSNGAQDFIPIQSIFE